MSSSVRFAKQIDFLCYFTSRVRIFQSCLDVIIAGEGLQEILMAIKQGGIFIPAGISIVPYFL